MAPAFFSASLYLFGLPVWACSFPAKFGIRDFCLYTAPSLRGRPSKFYAIAKVGITYGSPRNALARSGNTVPYSMAN